MRVVQLRRGRVLKLLLLAVVSVLGLVLVYRCSQITCPPLSQYNTWSSLKNIFNFLNLSMTLTPKKKAFSPNIKH